MYTQILEYICIWLFFSCVYYTDSIYSAQEAMCIKRHGSCFRNGFSNSHISCQTEFLKCFSHRVTALQRPRTSSPLSYVRTRSKSYEIMVKKHTASTTTTTAAATQRLRLKPLRDLREI